MSIIWNLFILIKILLFDRINSLSKNLNNSEIYSINNISTIKRKLADNEYRPIKIYFDTFHMETSTFSNVNKFKKIKEMVLNSLTTTKSIIEKLFMVKNGEINVNINDYKEEIKKLYGESYYKDNELLNNLNADLIILVDYSESDLVQYYDCKEYSLIIKRQGDRPIIGYFEINGQIFQNIVEDYSKLEFYKYYMLHQTTHILGFTRTTLKNKIFTHTYDRGGKPYSKEIIMTYNLKEYAKEYFNCYDKDFGGIEIEELVENTGCNELIHWDSRILSFLNSL